MPSLIRFLCLLGLLAAFAYVGMFALVSMVEPTQREFVITIPQDRLGKKVAGTANQRRAARTDRLQAVDPGRLARVLENLEVSR